MYASVTLNNFREGIRMSTTYEYPASFTEDAAGRMVVLFPDMPEALTDGADMNEAITEAKDCLL